MNAAGPTLKRIPLPHTNADATIRDWVEALARGVCDSAQFLQHLRQQGRENAELIWEALALLDQSFRSKRIDRDTFLPIKINLQQFALRHSDEAAPVIAAPASPEPIRIGTLLRGRYRIIGTLAKGAMGTVVEAIDEMRADAPENMQRIAIRILDARQLQEPGQMPAYLSHVCKLQTLSHPNLLRVFDFDQDQGRPFLTMELLAGSRLPKIIAPTDSPLRYQLDRLHVLRCVAGALQCAHAQGVVHGELRAEEVFITLTGDVRLMGLYDAFNRTSDDIPKDHLAFAWLVRDLLGGGANSEQLRRPEGLTDKQWRALEAVILGKKADGARLLQLFAEPLRAAGVEEIYTVSYVPPPDTQAVPGRVKWLWSLLLVGLAGGAGYLAYDRLDQKSLFTTTASVARATSSRATRPVTVPDGKASTPRAAAEPASAPATHLSIIYLAQSVLQVEDGNAVARVRVAREGNLADSVEFVWWTESGSAEPDVDFYAVTPRGAQFPANSASVDLFVPLVPAALHKDPVTFYVKIDEAGAGAALGRRTLAQVSVVPSGNPAVQ